MKELVEYIAKNIVDRPESVSVNERENESGTVYELRVAPGDMGKIIGRRGRTARDIRTLVRAAAKCQGKRANVTIVE